MFNTLFKWIAFWVSADIRASVSSYNAYEKAGSNAQNQSVPHNPSSSLSFCACVCVCLRYNASSVVFFCLPALLAQPLWGAAAFCWQNVLQGVWYGWFWVTSPSVWIIIFRYALPGGKCVINDKWNYSRVASWPKTQLNFAIIKYYWYNLFLILNPDCVWRKWFAFAVVCSYDLLPWLRVCKTHAYVWGFDWHFRTFSVCFFQALLPLSCQCVTTYYLSLYKQIIIQIIWCISFV